MTWLCFEVGDEPAEAGVAKISAKKVTLVVKQEAALKPSAFLLNIGISKQRGTASQVASSTDVRAGTAAGSTGYRPAPLRIYTSLASTLHCRHSYSLGY